MNIISHMFSGIIILKILNLINPNNFPFTSNFILLAMFFSILPDLEGIWSKKTIDEHHETPFHTTLFWLTIAFIMLMINFFLHQMSIFIVFLLIIMVLAHIIFDFIFSRFSGVPILQPFCSRQYSLTSPFNFNVDVTPRKINKKKYKTWAKMYFKNKVLVVLEFIIWIVGILLLVIR